MVFQELSNRSPCFFQIAIFATVDFFVLKCLDKTLGLGIVIGGSGAAHADTDTVLFQQHGVVVRSLLHTAIGEMHQAGLGPALPERHG